MYLKYFLSFVSFLVISFNSFSEVIKKIDVSGISNIDRGTILNYLPIEVGDDFDPNDSYKVRNSLMKTDLFSDVSLSFNNGVFLVHLSENPTIKFVEFKGYEEDIVLSEKIITLLQDNSQIKVGKIFTEKNFAKFLGEIKTLYINNGFYGAEISSKKLLDQSNRIGIEMNIKDGEPARIKNFITNGNNHFDNDFIVDLFDIGTADWFLINYFTERDQFKKKEFEAGLEKVKSKYLESGFLDVKVSGSIFDVNDKNTSLSLKVNIVEGSQYFVDSVQWSGDIKNINESKLTNTFEVNSGDVFSRSEILKGANKVKALFANIGYAKSEVTTSLEPSDKKNFIKLIVKIDKKDKMYVNRIEISGNTSTQDDVIRRQLLILEGQEFSQSQLDESIKNIKRLGFFSDVKIFTKISSKDIDKFDIFIDVEETKTGEFTIGLSHANATGASFNTGIQQNNILGTGNVFNAKFVSSKAVEELRFYFKNPYFTKEGESISYGAFTKSTDAENLDISSYLLDETGVTLGYGIPVSKTSDIFVENTISDISLTCSEKFSGILYEQQQCSDDKSLDFNLSFNYLNNSLNDYYNPTKGSKNILTSAIALPIGDFKYYKIESKNSYYQPIFDNSTIHSKLNLQLAQGYANENLPFFKRYFGGGASSVRGFDFNSLGTKYPDLNAKGGEVSLLSSLSIISPGNIIGIDNENIRISAFLDAGSIFEKTSNFDLSDIRVSSGLAASWLTPIGPIGVFFAQPLIKKDSDTTETFSFELGASF